MATDEAALTEPLILPTWAPPPPPRTTLDKLKTNFPFPTIRRVQEQALEVVADSYDRGVKFTALEVPTGGGKSGIGFAPARWSANSGLPEGGAHYLTSQNSLTQQLTQDFGQHGLVRIKGKANYDCETYRTNCADGSMLNNNKTCEGCPYREAKNCYVSGNLGVTNYSYYLAETMYSGELTPREYLVCDEAHNIEREILALVDITITQHRCEEIGIARLPLFDPGDDDKVRSWLDKKFGEQLKASINQLSIEIDRAKEAGVNVSLSTQKRYSALSQLNRNIDEFLQSGSDDWLAWSDKDGQLLIKPLTAAGYADRYLFKGSSNVVLMSATLLDFDTFRRNLGIRKSQINSFAVPSEFPAKNRRIVYWPVGSMGAKSIDQTLPRLAERTSALMTKFGGDKGIIHTHSYRINNYLNNALSDSPHADRITTHSALRGAREQAIANHYRAEFPSVLMSPSMTEGLDLKNDLSRFQVITKIPYPFLDPYNRKRMERDPKWYQLQTALTLVQATGRSVRSEEDYALTVILDKDFERFLSQNQDILPKWWLDSIEFR